MEEIGKEKICKGTLWTLESSLYQLGSSCFFKSHRSLSPTFIPSLVWSPMSFPISVTFQLVFATSAESWSPFLCSRVFFYIKASLRPHPWYHTPMAALNARPFHRAKLSWRSRGPKESVVSIQHKESYWKPHRRHPHSPFRKVFSAACHVTPYNDQSQLSLL